MSPLCLAEAVFGIMWNHGVRVLDRVGVNFVIPDSHALTPRNPQKNHSVQHFLPNLFLERWLKG
jgi:hypothetical protein